MKGDFSRDTFNPHKHFSRVLQQQGRVQLDADTNEQTAILLHYLRTLAADLIGPYARPAGSDGFKITGYEGGNFSISAGRFYVDGILCENEDAEATYKNQPDYPDPPDLSDLLCKNGICLIYLDVWERHITELEDPDIREKALGGPDTTTRTKVVCQVKVDAGDNDDGSCMFTSDLSCTTDIHCNWKAWKECWQSDNRGRLRARVKLPEDSTDPCLAAPDAKYRGQENQLYRIEIHKGGQAKNGGNSCATFKWSRDNGSVVSRVVEFSGKELVVEKPHGFKAGIWVEIISDGQELRGEPGSLVKLIKVDGDRFMLESPVPASCTETERQPAKIKIRRWDQRGSGNLKLENGAVPITESNDNNDGWIEIENGIKIQFVPTCEDSGAHRYRTGDYWLIPARIATGDIEWPQDDQDKEMPCAQLPHGIYHHYAPLAIIKTDGDSCDDLCCEFKPQYDCPCE
ncbi:MAG: hypothetical protein KF888_07735 [Nitrosomonas sp.]|nr:hypothetical protein [Nitrosomonas sp.]